VLALTAVNQLAGDAHLAAADFVKQGGHIQPWQPALLQNADVIVDAILGTGARPPLRGVQAAAIAAVNAAGRPVLALDLPSGLDGDSGSTLGDAIRADVTVCFVALKQGLFLGAGPELTGAVTLDDLGVAIPLAKHPAVLTRLSTADIRLALPPRAGIHTRGTLVAC
jgi:NAD(P)H-hydrate epimerase